MYIEIQKKYIRFKMHDEIDNIDNELLIKAYRKILCDEEKINTIFNEIDLNLQTRIKNFEEVQKKEKNPIFKLIFEQSIRFNNDLKQIFLIQRAISLNSVYSNKRNSFDFELTKEDDERINQIEEKVSKLFSYGDILEWIKKYIQKNSETSKE